MGITKVCPLAALYADVKYIRVWGSGSAFYGACVHHFKSIGARD